MRKISYKDLLGLFFLWAFLMGFVTGGVGLIIVVPVFILLFIYKFALDIIDTYKEKQEEKNEDDSGADETDDTHNMDEKFVKFLGEKENLYSNYYIRGVSYSTYIKLMVEKYRNKSDVEDYILAKRNNDDKGYVDYNSDDVDELVQGIPENNDDIDEFDDEILNDEESGFDEFDGDEEYW